MRQPHHASCFLMIWDYSQGMLGVDIVNAISKNTGRTAIIMLMLSLACTPLNTVFGFRQALTVRKSLGLWAFPYASLHLLDFVGLIMPSTWALSPRMRRWKSPTLWPALLSLFILLPLAITSTRGWMKRLGRNWKRLHKFVYAAGVLTVLHFFWQAKVAERWEPLLYGLGLALLLMARASPVRRWIAPTRTMLTRRHAPAPRVKVERMTTPVQ